MLYTPHPKKLSIYLAPCRFYVIFRQCLNCLTENTDAQHLDTRVPLRITSSWVYNGIPF